MSRTHATGLQLSVVAEPAKVVAPGSARFAIRVHNTTAHAYGSLRIGIEPVVDHSPVEVGRFVPALPGSCKAAAGTAFCDFPRLTGHGTVREVITIHVPLRFTPDGRSTVGHQVQLEAFLERDNTGALVTPIRHAHTQIAAAPSTLPFTGFQASGAVLFAGVLIAAGVINLLVGRRHTCPCLSGPGPAAGRTTYDR